MEDISAFVLPIHFGHCNKERFIEFSEMRSVYLLILFHEELDLIDIQYVLYRN